MCEESEDKMNNKQWFICALVFTTGCVMCFVRAGRIASLPIDDVSFAVYSALNFFVAFLCFLVALTCFLCGLWEGHA